MRTTLLALILITTTIPAWATRAGERIGVGLELGTFAAVTGKYWIDSKRAVDAGVGLGFDAWTTVYADYLFHRARIFGSDTRFARETIGYAGGGAGLAFHRSGRSCGRWSCRDQDAGATGVALRAPVGLEWMPPTVSCGVFAEVIPALLIGSGVGVGLDVGVGARYYF